MTAVIATAPQNYRRRNSGREARSVSLRHITRGEFRVVTPWKYDASARLLIHATVPVEESDMFAYVRSLPLEKLRELRDLAEDLLASHDDAALVASAAHLSQASLEAVWGNSEDDDDEDL